MLPPLLPPLSQCVGRNRSSCIVFFFLVEPTFANYIQQLLQWMDDINQTVSIGGDITKKYSCDSSKGLSTVWAQCQTAPSLNSYAKAPALYFRLVTAEHLPKGIIIIPLSHSHLIYGTALWFVISSQCDYSPGEHIILANTTAIKKKSYFIPAVWWECAESHFPKYWAFCATRIWLPWLHYASELCLAKCAWLASEIYNGLLLLCHI